VSNPAPAARTWRATLIVGLVFVAVAIAALAGWWYAREALPHQGPIVLISINGLRPDRLPAYGASRTDTPSIDALAEDSVVFERAYTHSPLTLPAHASLLTGRLPFEHGVRDEAGFVLKDEAQSLAELLANRGFETGGAVSSFLLRRESGVAQGFSFFDMETSEPSNGLDPIVGLDGLQTADAAERWVRGRRGQRFFLFVQVSDEAADSAVTQLMRQLKQLDLYDQATIVLTADRGERGTGASLDEASLHVPLLVKQPDGKGAGRRVASPVQHIDVLPTVLDLVRAPIPSGLRGRSLRAVLDTADAGVGAPLIYAESLAAKFRLGGQGVFAVSRGPYRYVRGSRDELVDLDHGTVMSPPPDTPEAAELRTALDRLLEGHVVDLPAKVPVADEDHLAAFGYLGGAAVAADEPLTLEPTDEAELLVAHRAAAMLVSRKQYAAAIDRLRAIVRGHPHLAAVHYQLGALLLRTGRLSEAIAAYRAAATLQPDNAYVPVAIAVALVRAGIPDDAWRQAMLAVALAERRDERSRAAAHEIAARVALARRDPDEARTHADSAQAADPGLPMPQFVRGRLLYENGNYEAALAAFEEADAALDARGRTLEELQWYLGDTLARLDRYEDAEAHFREELRLFPRNIPAYASLATLYRASNRDRSLEDVIAALIDSAPTPEGYATAARLWTILGERERADALRADARARFNDDTSLATFERGGRR
jgi:choline-sulfatase